MATDHDPLDPRLAEAIGGLRDREPTRDLWPGISRRLERRRPGVLQIRWPMAIAAALTLVAGGAALSRLLVPGSPSPEEAVASGVDTSSGTPPLLPAGFDRAEATLSTAIDQLEAAYAQAEATLDPEVRAAIAGSLAAIDSAIVEARRRAGEAPADIDAARYLTRTMQRKLNVLRSAATMASRS